MPGFSLAATRYDEDARKNGSARRIVGKSLAILLNDTAQIVVA